MWKPKVGERARLKTLKEMQETPGLNFVDAKNSIFRLGGKVFKVTRFCNYNKQRRNKRSFWFIDIKHSNEPVEEKFPSDLLIKLSYSEEIDEGEN